MLSSGCNRLRMTVPWLKIYLAKTSVFSFGKGIKDLITWLLILWLIHTFSNGDKFAIWATI